MKVLFAEAITNFSYAQNAVTSSGGWPGEDVGQESEEQGGRNKESDSLQRNRDTLDETVSTSGNAICSTGGHQLEHPSRLGVSMHTVSPDHLHWHFRTQ
jgi:hypothetical protein